MKVEVINTGSELLFGHTLNSHLSYIGRELFTFGLRIDRQATVPDGEAIRHALVESLARADLIFVTGGLGPTSDDVTRDVAAELLGRKLVLRQEVLDKILGYFARRKRVPSVSVNIQAMVPEGALVLDNDYGTAPGLLLEHEGKVLILLPGPPRELQPMWREKVAPWLAQRLADQPKVYQKMWRIVGWGESQIQQLLEADLRQIAPFEIGYCARPNEVDFRLISGDVDALDKAEAFILSKVGKDIFATGDEALEAVVIRLATEAGRTLATAESCTGGLIAHRLTNVPGSSVPFRAGYVTYSNESKERDLGVPHELIERHGAVSEEVARSMAENARSKAGVDLAVAVTGIAGPGGGSDEKPVGSVWFGLASERGVVSLKKNLSSDRETFKYMASQTALDLFRRKLI